MPARADARAVRFGQAATGVLTLVAFLLDAQILVPVAALILGLGAFFGPRFNPWNALFVAGVKPALRLGAPTKFKDPAPPRFANAIGFLFLTAATALLFTGSTIAIGGIALGWVLVLIVSALALLAAATNLCVGCEIYVLLQRLRPAAQG